MASAVKPAAAKTPLTKAASASGSKRSEFICRTKFRNALPDVPYDAKCLELPFETERFVQYSTTTLERQHRHQLYTELDLGIPIDLIDPNAYKPIRMVYNIFHLTCISWTATRSNRCRTYSDRNYIW